MKTFLEEISELKLSTTDGREAFIEKSLLYSRFVDNELLEELFGDDIDAYVTIEGSSSIGEKGEIIPPDTIEVCSKEYNNPMTLEVLTSILEAEGVLDKLNKK